MSRRRKQHKQKTQEIPTVEMQTVSWGPVSISLLILAGVWFVYSVLMSPADPDLWGHVQYGRDALQHGLDRTTTYSYNAEGYRWINHENLSELILATIYDAIGVVGLQLFRSALAVLFTVMLWARARDLNCKPAALLAVILLVCVNIMLNWMLRPQLLSYFFCVCTVFVLCVAFRGQEGNFCILARSGSQNPRLPTPLTQSKYWLGLLPVVMVLWTNAHGGFLAGLAIVGAYLGLRCFELYWLRPEGYIRDIRFLCIIGIATASASLINPYGWSLHLWLLESLGTPRPEIVEWRGIDLARPKAWNYCLLIGGTAGAYLFSKRRVDLTHFVILVLVGWQAILHRRHVPFYVILFAFWLMPHIDSFLSDRRRPSIVVPTWLQRATVALALLAAGYFGTQWMTRVQHLPVHRFQFPVQALRFMKAQGLHTEGRIVVMYGWAQYVLGAFGARTADDVGLRLACDGRFRTCYPQEVLDQLLDFELGGQMRRERSPRSGPIDGSRILREGNPDLVLVNRLQSHAVYIMEKNQSQWTLIYQDQIAELWGRSSIYDNPDHERYVPRIDRLKLTTQDLSSAQWPAYP